MAPESDASRGAREDTYVEELGVGQSVPVGVQKAGRRRSGGRVEQ
jgi:hypothetical protein